MTFSVIKAVIFDMDGLMIDSEPYHVEAYNKVLEAMGHHLSDTENLKYVGVSDKYICHDLVQTLGLKIAPTELENRKREAYKQLLEKEVVAKPGLITLVKQLHEEKFKLAVASSSPMSEINTVLKRLSLLNLFDELVSSDAVEHGKPAPDVFLYAARKLGVEPKDCLVLEDAPSGLQAAKSANMLCYVIPSRDTQEENFALADKKLTSLSEVHMRIIRDSQTP